MQPADAYAEVGRSYGKLVSDAAAAALGIANGIADLGPREMSMWLLSEMPGLEKLTNELATAGCPAEAADAHGRLVAGLRAFADDLMAVYEEAALEASQEDVYQRGLLTPSIAITAVVEGCAGSLRTPTALPLSVKRWPTCALLASPRTESARGARRHGQRSAMSPDEALTSWRERRP